MQIHVDDLSKLDGGVLVPAEHIGVVIQFEGHTGKVDLSAETYARLRTFLIPFFISLREEEEAATDAPSVPVEEPFFPAVAEAINADAWPVQHGLSKKLFGKALSEYKRRERPGLSEFARQNGYPVLKGRPKPELAEAYDRAVNGGLYIP